MRESACGHIARHQDKHCSYGFSFGLNATFADVTCLFRNPSKLGRALLAMNVFMPVLALILAMTLHLHPAVKIALVALSISPVPPFFPKRALKEGGNDDYTVGLLTATALLAIVLIPITIEILARIARVPMNMPPSSVAKLIFLTVLAPLLAGIALRKVMPSFARELAHPVGTLAMALLVLSLLPVLFLSARTIFSLIGNGTLFSLAGFALIGYFIQLAWRT
jgi:bile acid:Na+ symporter, BASS family